ncbi:geranylgeranylglyceryl/heptaprenylglyceryl phosphate synthase [Plebeiibacterium sediminum]|uniref:Geranylgeranylglyceryl phosphate synthase n=1 Tax=Plebeiibacterium sediminum TaxID=2992112 RepID=A0AAE3SGU5_9BACT|nr:geranylgeranylglyceryl/heptaprenylglyceryl phosphate synthase [Plebeiobacterium sediminum]MCW3788477.1 geranylgeranylglyceryl/heptaprenylglyceryl phosphate synthase [Plebeiobacterium sediminum]
MILESVLDKKKANKKVFCVLIDPDKFPEENILKIITAMETAAPDLILVGGSLVTKKTESTVDVLKKHLSIPVLLFPGSLLQLTTNADGILFISLISGRNPELLIGNHVASAPVIRSSGMEVISTGYILIDGGTTTSVEYMSQTKPIPALKTDIAVATAMAGEMLGQKLIYLEGGSGALNPVPVEMIEAVKQNISIPLIVGGGLNTKEKVKAACDAGADIIVVGNAFEKDLSLLKEFKEIVSAY